MDTAKLVEFCEQLKSLDLQLADLLKENEETKKKLIILQRLTAELLDTTLEEISERG